MQKLLDLIYSCVDAKLRGVFTAIPGKIVAYDFTTQKAQVKPLAKLIVEDEDEVFDAQNPSDAVYEEIDVIFDVPVHHPSGSKGKAYVYIPIVKEDLGMLLFSTFSMENYLSGDGTTFNVEEIKTHDLSDAFFIPGILPFKAALSISNPNNMIFKNDKSMVELAPTGTVKIEGGPVIKVELVAKLIEIVDKLITGTVPTMMGPQQLSTVPDLVLIKAALETIKGA